MIKYLKYFLVLIMLLPSNAVAQNTPSTIDTLNSQFYWLLRIYLDSPCQASIPVTTPKRTFTVERSQLLQSLRYIYGEIERSQPSSNPVPLEELLQKECRN
ncbi:hypothetical protein C7H19_15085 [Aphanothece hegewaldii CCALA 016]|uniref:Uncharacterized protein n=1 Tax=Aphanothece hegewaldii CCALA 016 TaxID=2107694 RepID=A0A2T1LVJ0_9CHRO|nr:hypothetical protein [Aphanothece hegewaldii]PSF35748.1 hypothetical protein C7H19_15085 [Aphanothece hegewaldii CCALA 016]